MVFKFFCIASVFLLGFTNPNPPKVKFACSYYGDAIAKEILDGNLADGFSSSRQAVDAVNRVLEPTGLKKNFIIREDPRVGNACAIIIDDERYILYNNQFMETVAHVTHSDWASVSIIAHEIGHHLNGHTLDGKGSRPDKELEADEFSGHAMYLLGASLQDAQKAMNSFASDEDGPTHPGKFKRLNAIAKGWEKAHQLYPSKAGVTTRSSTPASTPSPSVHTSHPFPSKTTIHTRPYHFPTRRSSAVSTEKPTGDAKDQLEITQSSASRSINPSNSNAVYRRKFEVKNKSKWPIKVRLRLPVGLYQNCDESEAHFIEQSYKDITKEVPPLGAMDFEFQTDEIPQSPSGACSGVGKVKAFPVFVY